MSLLHLMSINLNLVSIPEGYLNPVLKCEYKTGEKGWATPPLKPLDPLLLQQPTWYLFSKLRAENTCGIITRQEPGVSDSEELMMLCIQMYSFHQLFLLGTLAIFSCLLSKQASSLKSSSCLGSAKL